VSSRYASTLESAAEHGGACYHEPAMAELGLAVFLVAALLVTSRERLEWAAAKLRDLLDWLSS